MTHDPTVTTESKPPDPTAGLAGSLLQSFVHNFNQTSALLRGDAAKHAGLANAADFAVPFPGNARNDLRVNTGLGWPGLVAFASAIIAAMALGARFSGHDRLIERSVERSSQSAARDSQPPFSDGPLDDRDWVFGIIKDEE